MADGGTGLSGGGVLTSASNGPGATADISNVTVVEVFYKYTPITPISRFAPGLFTNSGGTIISSKAVF